MIDDIAPLTPELLVRLEARGFDVEGFTQLDLGVGESTRFDALVSSVAD
jgi:hypothetical protein